MDTLNKTIVISTHSLVYGAPQALREYLIKHRVANLLFISHPLLEDNVSRFEIIKNGVSIKKNKFLAPFKSKYLNYISQLLSTLIWSLFWFRKIDLFIGVDPLNSFAGVILKKLGIVKKLIYYTIDYVPKRFDNRIVNSIYHYCDILGVRQSFQTWNVSPRIAEARNNSKKLTKDLNKQIVVPIGIWYDRIKRISYNQIHKHQLFFIGHIIESAGIQLVLEAMPKIISEISDFHFLIVGGGEYENELKKIANHKGISQYITFKGWIKERNKLDSIMSDSALAVALYDPSITKTTWFSDPTKLKDYMSAGLPVILTKVPHNAIDIEKHRCGIIVEYDKEKVSEAIIHMLKNENLLQIYRDNSLKYAKKYDWNEIFSKYFLPIL